MVVRALARPTNVGLMRNKREAPAPVRSAAPRRIDPELLRFEDATPRVKSSYAPPTSYTTPTKALDRPTTADRWAAEPCCAPPAACQLCP